MLSENSERAVISMNKIRSISLLIAAGLLLAGCNNCEKKTDEKDNKTEESSQKLNKEITENKKVEKNENKSELEKEKNSTQNNDSISETTEQNKKADREKSSDEKVSSDTENQDDTAQFGRDDQRWKVKNPTQMPGDNPVIRKHVAMMLVNNKLRQQFLNAQDILNGRYTSAAGQSTPFANAMLVSGGYVPMVEDAPTDMAWFLLSPSKVNDKSLIGVSDKQIVISTTSIDEGNTTGAEKIDYPAMVASEGTQVFNVQDLENESNDSEKVNNVANKLYMVSPHTIQRVPTK